MKKICVILLTAVWAALAGFAWFGPVKEISQAERRPLAKRPEVSVQAIASGSFMEKFEDYAVDQFPLRDSFRRVKSLFHTCALGQKDNNGIYIADGYAAKQEYPLKEDSVEHFIERMNYLHDKYLGDSKVVMAIVPDKGNYLAAESGHLALDYGRLYAMIGEGMPWAAQVDLRDVLTASDYYRTDTHWRQEKLLPAAGKLAGALGVTAPNQSDFTVTALERPFYGVYYGQAALPMEPETMNIMESQWLSQCTVYDHESGKTLGIYDLEKAASARDMYEVFLSGSKSLLTIENPNGTPGKELIVFRDSFGSSMAPLLAGKYEKVTVVDVRYIRIDVLERFLEFHGQDVLLLYSTLVLNQSSQIQ